MNEWALEELTRAVDWALTRAGESRYRKAQGRRPARPGFHISAGGCRPGEVGVRYVVRVDGDRLESGDDADQADFRLDSYEDVLADAGFPVMRDVDGSLLLVGQRPLGEDVVRVLIAAGLPAYVWPRGRRKERPGFVVLDEAGAVSVRHGEVGLVAGCAATLVPYEKALAAYGFTVVPATEQGESVLLVSRPVSEAHEETMP